MAIKTLTKLVLPKEPDTICTRPALAIWPFCVLKNQRILANSIYSNPVYRKELMSFASNYTEEITGKKISYDDKKPIIASGHQPNWHHCGIFIKNCIGQVLANVIDAIFVHIIIDHDGSSYSLTMPSGDRIALIDEMNIPPLLPKKDVLPNPNFHSKCNAFIERAVKRCPVTAMCNIPWRAIIDDNMLSKCKNHTDLMTVLLSGAYIEAKVMTFYLPVSHLSQSTAFKDFVTQLLSDFENFTKTYNLALDYDNKLDIHRLDTQPIASFNLKEFPLWIKTSNGTISSLYIGFVDHNHIVLASNKDIILSLHKRDLCCIFDHLEHKGYFLRPKAILLSLFLRLFLTDWFIHGIGGARYETVTDFVLSNYFNIKTLQFGIATMTSHLLRDNYEVHKSKLASLFHKNRLFAHNPEQLLTYTLANIPEIKTLIEKKQQLISVSIDANQSSQTRKGAWREITSINHTIQSYLSATYSNLQGNLREITEKTSFYQSREFFFGLYPRKYLLNLSEEINNELQYS